MLGRPFLAPRRNDTVTAALRRRRPGATRARAAGGAKIRFKEAAESFRQLVKIEPRPEWREALATAYVGRGRTLAAKGMYKEATMVFDNATDVDGAVHESLLYLACLVRLGDTAKAARLCSKLLVGNVKGVTAEALTAAIKRFGHKDANYVGPLENVRANVGHLLRIG